MVHIVILYKADITENSEGSRNTEMVENAQLLDTISVYPDGDFEIFFFDGEMFWGHSIIVNGNINGDFSSANIAG